MKDNRLLIPCDKCRKEFIKLEQKEVKGKLMRLCKQCVKELTGGVK